MLKLMGSALPTPPPDVQPSILWGTEEHVRELFAGKGVELEFERVMASLGVPVGRCLGHPAREQPRPDDPGQVDPRAGRRVGGDARPHAWTSSRVRHAGRGLAPGGGVPAHRGAAHRLSRSPIPGYHLSRGAIAQLGERVACTDEVAGSSPAGSTGLRLTPSEWSFDGRRPGSFSGRGAAPLAPPPLPGRSARPRAGGVRSAGLGRPLRPDRGLVGASLRPLRTDARSLRAPGGDMPGSMCRRCRLAVTTREAG